MIDDACLEWTKRRVYSVQARRGTANRVIATALLDQLEAKRLAVARYHGNQGSVHQTVR